MFDALLMARTEVGPLKWASLPPAWLTVVLVVAGFLWVRAVYLKERGRSGPFQRHFLAALRVLALVLILLVLGGPYREETRTATERSHLVVLVDSSASMRVKDTYEEDEGKRLMDAAWPGGGAPQKIGETSRGDLVRQVLGTRGTDLLARWAERFELHVFAFDSDWRSLVPTPEGDEVLDDATRAQKIADSIAKLPMDGGQTNLGGVLRNVANEYSRSSDRHLAGVILISDGRDTSEGETPQEVMNSLGPIREDLRVVAVGLGNPTSGSNLFVDSIRAKDVVLVRDEVVFENTLRHIGFPGVEGVRCWITAEKIREPNGDAVPPGPGRQVQFPEGKRFILEESNVRLGGDEEPTSVRLRARFDEPGTFEVTVHAELPPQLKGRDSVPEDDRKTFELVVKDERIRVLYIDQLPRPDWRFLSNYLTREPPPDERYDERRSRFLVNVLLQNADRKFEQPTSTDPNVRPLETMPKTKAELFEYDVIIVGDVDLTRFRDFTAEDVNRVLPLLVEFVENGGGLVFQAGWTYNNPLEYLETPLAQLLPVVASEKDRDASEGELTRAFNIQLTDVGREHPIFQVVPGQDGGIASPDWTARYWRGDHSRSKEWAWYWLYRSRGGLRPGATALATVRTRGTSDWVDERGRPLVVFATMPFAKGRVFWSSLDLISRIRREHRDTIYGGFWEQVIRYLATYRLLGGNRRYKVFTDKEDYFVGDVATVEITALDPSFEPLEDAYLDDVRIETPDGETIEWTGEQRPKSQADQGEVGTYRAYLPLRKQGQYRIWIEKNEISPATGRSNRERAERRISANFRAREDILKVPDHETLRNVVRATNPGATNPEVLKLYDLEGIADRLTARPRERVLDRKQHKQWDKWWVLAILAGLLGIEWALRKRWQMI